MVGLLEEVVRTTETGDSTVQSAQARGRSVHLPADGGRSTVECLDSTPHEAIWISQINDWTTQYNGWIIEINVWNTQINSCRVQINRWILQIKSWIVQIID
jgi:hypothetical protein